MTLTATILTAAADPSGGAGAWFAPGGIVAGVAGIFAFAAREYRAGRREDVEAANKRATEAEGERDAIRAERANDVDSLKTEVQSLRDEVRKLHEEINLMRESHDRQLQEREEAHRRDLAQANARLVRETAVGWRLREVLAQNGVALPADLDPAHPSTPQLDVAGYTED